MSIGRPPLSVGTSWTVVQPSYSTHWELLQPNWWREYRLQSETQLQRIIYERGPEYIVNRPHHYQVRYSYL